MKRVRLTIAYDGTNYAGYQIQPALPTVEGEVQRALWELTGEDITLIGASRTDSGVHAMANVAAFDTESPIPGEKFALALNPHLPEDIRAVSSAEVASDWHPRKQDSRKTYIYRIWNSNIDDPLSRLYKSRCHFRLDVEAMQKASEYLIGEHDFTSFSSPNSQVLLNGGSAVRTIYSVEVRTDGTQMPRNVEIEVTGSGFLYNMVRIIAGSLLEVGTGRKSPEWIGEALAAKDRTAAGPTVEARGLVLKEIRFSNDLY